MINQDVEITPRRVLVIAYYFPPMGLSGVQRTLKFVKYLPHYGWHPTVLSVEPQGYAARDESLLADLQGKPIEIVRTPAAGPGWFLKKKQVVELPAENVRKALSRLSDTVFFPDNKIGWRRRAVAAAVELHRKKPFDLIFATAPPFTDFLIGADVKKKIVLPLVFDYRDPWVDYPFRFNATPLHKLIHTLMERRALRASSHVVTTNRRVKELLINRHKFLTYHDIEIIPQGFDPDDLAQASEALRAKGQQKTGKMRITYAGVFWEDRVPDHFLQALHDLLDEQPRLRGRIEAVFAGNFREENKALITKLRLQDTVTILGYLPHQQCLAEILAADVTWVVVGDDMGSPGKTYEYIGARKPILGLAPEGFIKQAIVEAGGRVVPPTDVPGIKNALAAFFDEYEHKNLTLPSLEVAAKYNRVALTGNLVKLFESLLGA